MAGSYSHLFDAQAADYAEYRPTYPPDLYDKIYKFCDFDGQPALALDVATGSGQAAVDLAKVFKQVLAIDSNSQQLKEAKKADNVEYRKGLAEATTAADNSVDLVAVAQGLHWFDLSKFWFEAARVLKPGAVLAAWGHAFPICKDNTAATKSIADWGYGDHMLGPYWSHRRRLVDDEYASIVPDQSVFGDAVRTKVVTTTECTIDFFVKYLSTWSAYPTYRQRNPDKEDPLIQIKETLLSDYNTSSGAVKMELEWHIFLLMAKAKK